MKDTSKKKIFVGLGLGALVILGYYFAKIINKKNNIPEDSTPESDNLSIIVGDSQTPFIAKQSKKVNMLGTTSGENVLWKSGINLKWLKDAISKYPVSKNIKNLIINIGTNGGFSAYDDVSGLVKEAKRVFPNAKLFVVKGSWGWGGNKNVTEKKVNDYYGKFKEQGVNVINPAIGKVIDPHSHLPIYKEIGKSIDNLL